MIGPQKLEQRAVKQIGNGSSRARKPANNVPQPENVTGTLVALVFKGLETRRMKHLKSSVVDGSWEVWKSREKKRDALFDFPHCAASKTNRQTNVTCTGLSYRPQYCLLHPREKESQTRCKVTGLWNLGSFLFPVLYFVPVNSHPIGFLAACQMGVSLKMATNLPILPRIAD